MANKGKRYKCPYCDYREYRSELIDHVGEEHDDMIPKDYTPARIVYNAINKKESESQYLADLQEIRKAYVQDVKENYSTNSIPQNGEKSTLFSHKIVTNFRQISLKIVIKM